MVSGPFRHILHTPTPIRRSSLGEKDTQNGLISARKEKPEVFFQLFLFHQSVSFFYLVGVVGVD
jgi:hypothetical protein